MCAVLCFFTFHMLIVCAQKPPCFIQEGLQRFQMMSSSISYSIKFSQMGHIDVWQGPLAHIFRARSKRPPFNASPEYRPPLRSTLSLLVQ